MNPSERQALLVRLKISQASIARDLALNPSAVSSVIAGRGRSQRIEEAISERTGVPLATLWPEWYGGAAATAEAMDSAPRGNQVRDDGGSYAAPPLGADAMALSADERRMVHLLRAMTPEQRARGVQLLKLVLADLDEAAGATVTASGKGSRAAGRDIKGR